MLLSLAVLDGDDICAYVLCACLFKDIERHHESLSGQVVKAPELVDLSGLDFDLESLDEPFEAFVIEVLRVPLGDLMELKLQPELHYNK